MIDSLIEMVKTNEFAQGALLAAPATALSYAARNIPVSIWNSMKHFVSYDLVFRSDQEEYYYVSKLIMDEVINEKWSRDFTYDSSCDYQHVDGPEGVYTTSRNEIGLSIGYGRHWGRYKGAPVIVHRQMEEETHSEAFKEMLYVTFIGFNNNSAKVFAEEVHTMMESRNKQEGIKVKVKVSSHGGWLNVAEILPRPLDTVFTSDGIKEKLMQHLKGFTESRDECLAKGIPWHTGVMLTGKPGGGKTSLCHAIAGELGRDVNFLNLSGVKSESDLVSLVTCKSTWRNSLLVIEDIDAMRASTSRSDKADGQVSLNGLLNILDGFLTPSGLITIATSNHPETLDPALVRSGRFDFIAELGPLERGEANKMAELLIGDCDFFSTDYVPMMGAEVREQLLKYKNIV